MLEFTKHPLERLKFVVQTGGNNPKVKFSFTGIESIGFSAFIFNKSYKLTSKGICRVFGEDNSYRGYIKLVDNMPKKFLPEPIDEDTTFSDWYNVVGE